MGSLVRQVVFSAADDIVAASLLDVGPEAGIVCDPGPVGLWSLESMLTGRSREEVVREAPDPVAMVGKGQRVVLPLGGPARDALARIAGWRLPLVIMRWSRTDEVRAEGLSWASTGELLRDLTSLARAAKAEDAHLYLWIDVDPRAL